MQQMQLLGGLGMIPSLQFSADPSINPNINPYVKFPEGMTQLTTQPTGEYRTSGEAQLQGPMNRLRFVGQGVHGLGVHMEHPAHRPAGLYRRPVLLDVAAGMGPAPLNGIFDSSWWVERKWLAFGLVGLLGLGAAALATKVLR